MFLVLNQKYESMEKKTNKILIMGVTYEWSQISF